MKSILPVALAFVLSLNLIACAEDAAEDAAVVARVNDAVIKRAELDAALQGIKLQIAQQGGSIPAAELANFERDVLNDMISRELILQESRKQPVTGLDAEVDQQLAQTTAQVGGEEALNVALERAGLTAAEYRARLRDNLLVQRTVKAAVEKDLKVSEEEITEFYNANRELTKEPEQAEARHILLRVAPDATAEEKAAKRAKIEAVREQLIEGGDFAALAKEHSEDPGSAAQGGSLGSFPKGMMAPEFDAVAFSQEIGKISEVITTQFGLHVLEVTGRAPAREIPLSEVSELIENHLKQQKGTQLAEAYVAGLRQTAKVEILLADTPAAP